MFKLREYSTLVNVPSLKKIDMINIVLFKILLKNIKFCTHKDFTNSLIKTQGFH